MNAILVDVTRCTGCERCVAACVETNGLDAKRAWVDRATTRDGLSANRPLSILEVEDGRFARLSCMHCLEPSCVSACLVGGITKTPEGPVIYDPDRCIGCRYCMLACPFHVPRYEWHETAPFMVKCAMCFERGDEGPACVEACPNAALTFGRREGLLREAHQRIAAAPGAYLPRVWGEHEFGGTSVLYLSDVDLGAIGWPRVGTEPIPDLTEPLIAKTPLIGLGVAAGLLGVNWVIRRRMRLGAEGRPAGEQAHD
ncbi:MAG TPA: 4Fe-4S dicluster domain-containing protein [Longimicrobiales bacterium]|jgi:formate dehydrogenase iron-sulfur subunit